jgi:flagellar M-ring protein FliF
MGNKANSYHDNLEAAKQLAKNDPKMVANVVKAWVGTNE